MIELTKKKAEPGSKIVPLNPLLKWAGGKSAFIPTLKDFYYPNNHKRTFVELFAGGLAASLALQPKKVIVNDVNPYLINFYIQVRDGLNPVEDFPEIFITSEDHYYSMRDRFNFADTDLKEKAALFYYLNKTGHRGMCRFNNDGEFNIPFGHYKKVNYAFDAQPYIEFFKRVQWFFGDFEKIVIPEDSFVFVDPPYFDSEDPKAFTKYSKSDFTWDDQVRLAKYLGNCVETVVLTNNYDPKLIELYSNYGFSCSHWYAPRAIDINGDRSPKKELIAVKPKKFASKWI